MLLYFFSKHLSVSERMQRKESLSETSGECGNWISDSHFSSGDLSSVATDEMVHGLLGGQLGDGGEDSIGIASQEDHILGVASYGGDLGAWDALEGIADS